MSTSFTKEKFFENYHAIRNQGGWVKINAGLLKIEGEDKSAFIQRQTTNDIRQLNSSTSLLTVLTSPTARILDVLILFTDEKVIYAVTLPGYQHKTDDFLRSRIFFMDKVIISNISDSYQQLDLFGPSAVQALNQLGVDPETVKSYRYFQFQDEQLIQLKIPHPMNLGFRLFIPQSKTKEFYDYLSSKRCNYIDPITAGLLRVELGLPGAETELTEEYTPLEVNLQDAISNNKGCYTGQEIIARQITYDKVTKKLIGLELSREAPIGTHLLAENQTIGTITSTAKSPQFGDIGLAVVKRPYDSPGETFLLEDNFGTAKTVLLPFGSL